MLGLEPPPAARELLRRRVWGQRPGQPHAVHTVRVTTPTQPAATRPIREAGGCVDIAITGRHVAVSDGLRAAVEDKLTHATRHIDGMDRAEVRFVEERNPRIAEKETCEATLFGHGHIVRAKATAADSYVALDRAVDKLEHRLSRLKGKLVKRSHARRSGSLDSPQAGHTQIDPAQTDHDTEAEEGHPRIVKTKQFSMKPMTAEEAALHMELLGHDFFFFSNADTGLAAVVYRRNDGDVGLIDAT